MATSKSAASPPALGLYVAAVGAAAATAFFDWVRNREVSALRKTGIALREMAESGEVTSGNASMFALLIFCLVAALMVYVYRPREHKEAFVLGLGVLGAMGMAIAPPAQTGLHAQAVDSPPAAVVGRFELLPSAHAQTPEPAAEARKAGVWIFLDGPQQLRTPETRVLIFSLQSKAAIVNAPANAAFYIALPPGSYQFELSHSGYRSVAFSASVEAGTQVFQVPMDKVDYEVQNFFGPTRVKPQAKPDLAGRLDAAVKACGSGSAQERGAGAPPSLGLDKRWIRNLSPEARRMLCV